MKVWSDVSVLLKLSVICIVVGFILGLCASGLRETSYLPAPTEPSSSVAKRTWTTPS